MADKIVVPGTPAVPPVTGTAKVVDPKAAPVVEPKRFKIGEEELSEQDIMNWKQKATEADKRFQAAAEMQRKYDLPVKQAQALVQALTSGDPTTVFELPEVSKNPKLLEAMEKLVWKAYQEKQMSPEQLEVQKRLARAAELERAESQRQSEAQKAKQAENNKLAMQRLDKTITDILSTAKVPKTKYTVSQVARLMQAALNKKQAPDPAQIVKQVENLYKEANDFYAESLTEDEALVNYLGPKVVERVRKYLVDKYNLKKKAKTASVTPPKREPKEKRKLSWDEWNNQQKGK
jgi:hypothetical protein